MAHRSSNQPLRITTIRQLPCEDVEAVFNAAIGRVLNARNVTLVRPEPETDAGDQVGESERPT